MSAVSRRNVLLSGAAVCAMPAASPQSSKGADPPERWLLATRYPLDKIAAGLMPREQWKPFPKAEDRAGWEALDADPRRSLVEAGEKGLQGDWPALPATLFLEFVRNGNRTNYERAVSTRRSRIRDLVLAECAEGKGRFTDQIANGVWLTCEETWWGYPAHIGMQRDGAGLPEVTEPVIDLFAAEAAALLAWTDYLVAPQLDQVHRKIRQRAAFEIERRILKPYQERDDFGWMGFSNDGPVNNWNPWINSNCLLCALLFEKDAGRRALMVSKVVRSLDRFLDGYHEDGGCDEGPSYWGHAGASLFDNLELLHSASAGRINAFDLPLVGEIGRYIYRVQIADDWYVNFADASARVIVDSDLVYRYGKRIGDRKMQELGADSAHRRGWAVGGEWVGRRLGAVFSMAEMRNAPARQPLLRDSWLPGIQVMTARVTEGSPKGLYVAAQGGHNAESHNHNDVGNFIVYADGQPAIIDAGVGQYTAETFSSRRYEIWTMQSAYHNLPTVNGVMQEAGRRYEARNVTHSATGPATEFALDLAAAYPESAGIDAWRRAIRLDRAKNTVEVWDSFALKQAGGRIDFTIMTPREVRTAGENEIALSGGLLSGAVRIRAAGMPFEVTTEEVSTEDPRLKAVWGPSIRRILLKASNVPAKGEFRVSISQI